MEGIHVFDNVYSLAQRQEYYNWVRNSNYIITGGADLTIEQRSDVALQSMYTLEELDRMGIIKNSPQEIKDALVGYRPVRSYSLIVDHLQNPHFHCDGTTDNITFLYYANLYWNPDWGGETVFANNEINDILYTSMFIPGRVVLFDSRIPHKPCTPTCKADNFRFTFVINFAKV